MTTEKKAQAVLWISTLSMVVAFVAWASISPLASQLQKWYGLTATEKTSWWRFPFCSAC